MARGEKEHTASFESVDLSGAIDILWQLKDAAAVRNQDVVVTIKPEGNDEFMNAFFAKVKSVKDEMGDIRKNINQIKELHSKIITEVSQQKSKEHTEKLDELLLQTSSTAKKVKDRLRDFEGLTKECREEYGEASSQSRVHVNMHGSLTKKFMELMNEYNQVQGRYKTLLRDRVARQVKVVNPNATPEEVAEAIANGGSDIFADKILSQSDQAAMNAYADVQSKHEDLVRLEASIREVDQLFMDMALMVEQQGELLDNIEESVSNSAEYTQQGVVQLVEAKRLQKSARKKMCCLAACFAVCLLIALSFVTNFLIPRF
ncbi:t-SNARE [Baffinella frigidus]|nr:t-SNARE [Cryptophyta sp. CCMP2293]